MFDTLLDEFEAVADQSTEAMTGGFRKLPVDDNEDNNVAVAIAEQAEGEVQLDSPDELLAVDERMMLPFNPVHMNYSSEKIDRSERLSSNGGMARVM